MGIDIYNAGMLRRETGFVASSKDWDVSTARYRTQVNVGDGGTTQIDNLLIVDMSTWTNKPSGADWTNFVRVYEYTDATEAGVEINSQPIDQNWAAGNHDAICFLITDTSAKTQYVVYYGETDLGAPGYTSDLTVTADSPAAGDYKIVQNDYYRVELDFSKGGCIKDIWTRVSGGDIAIGRVGNTNLLNTVIDKNGVGYQTINEDNPTITLIEGTTGANAGAVLVAFKITGVPDDTVGAGGAHLQDDSAVDITYENIILFCDSALIRVTMSIIIVNAVTTIRGLRSLETMVVNDYFSHCSYKYGSTHWVGVRANSDQSANYATKRYLSFFDVTSNDGIVHHYISETFQLYETQFWQIADAGVDLVGWRPDESGDNSAYSAGTETLTAWVQIDDFTEADGNNDTDGDQPAHRKSDELQSTVTDTNLAEITF